MRVLLVNSHGADPAYGGAERYVADLARGLLNGGHEPAVLSAFPPREDPGVETIVLHESDWRDARMRRVRNHVGDVVSAPWPGIGRTLRRTRPDIVHTSNLPGIGSGIWEAARRAGIPAVHTLHDYHLLCPRTTLTRRDGGPCHPSPLLCGVRTRRLARWTPAVRHVIAGSEHLLRVHEHLFGGASRRVIRLPLAPLNVSPIDPPHSPPRKLGYIGALTTTKGVELLLEVAADLAQHGIGVRIAGDGPLREHVTAAAVEYVGRVGARAKTEFLTSCDAGIVPSLWEEPSGPPYVVREWQAAGRPVLATRRGGLTEITAEDGVIPIQESAAGVVETTLKVLRGPDWRRALASVPAVEDDADVRRWMDAHEAVYTAARGPTPSAAPT